MIIESCILAAAVIAGALIIARARRPTENRADVHGDGPIYPKDWGARG
nr:hypothetical protein [uncultured Rhodopila sp.]